MTLREYRPEDVTRLAQLFYDTVHTVNAGDYTPAQLDAWAAGNVDLEGWNRSFLAHDTLVAETDGQIVGFADMSRSGCLNMLYVHRDYQRRGVAAALVGKLEHRAREAGTGRFETYASITARPFFEKQGYVVEAENRVIRNGVQLTNFKMTKP